MVEFVISRVVLVRIMTRIVRHNECFCIIKTLKGQETGLTGCINAYEKMHPVNSCIISSIEHEYHIISTQKTYFSLGLYESFGSYQPVEALTVHVYTPPLFVNLSRSTLDPQKPVKHYFPIIEGMHTAGRSKLCTSRPLNSTIVQLFQF